MRLQMTSSNVCHKNEVNFTIISGYLKFLEKNKLRTKGLFEKKGSFKWQFHL